MIRMRAVAISLKIPDNEAFTALAALRRLGVPVAKLERAVIWVFEDNTEAGFLERISRNEALFNPNKHVLRELAEGAPRAGETWIEELGQHDDLHTYLGAKPMPGISSGKRRIAWRLFGEDGGPVESATLADAITKLLCNPAIERALTA
ncbi:MAG: hypothetical protein ABI182_01490 [Candidatus Baltobacteraceae bacterium]